MATGVKISGMAAVTTLSAGDLGTCVQGGVNKNYDVGSVTAKAWVNFNGTGVVAIRDSFNVSSITDNGVGDYTVNFTNNLSSIDYSPAFGLGGGDVSTSPLSARIQGAKSVSLIRFRTILTNSPALIDLSDISMNVLGS